jgi:anaerobic selenocysteine-containing dehydrogenase
MQRARGGGNAVRAIACLPALAGHWRDPAGGLLLSTSGEFSTNGAALYRPELLAGRTPRTVNMSTIGNDLQRADPPIDALIVYNSNPVAVAPQSREVAKGFAREDLFTVVLEQFQTDTADYADYVLPATTQLEHTDVHKSYGHLYMLANNPAIDALGEALPNSEIFRRLAANMGFAEPCFRESDDEIAATAFADPSFDWERLKTTGWQRLDRPAAYAPFANGGFKTKSGKCEIYSEAVAALGLDPVPSYIPPHEVADKKLAARFPLAMISPPARNFLNSTFVNVKSLRGIDGEPHIEIHPSDAAARGITDGGLVRVYNDRGSLLLKACVTDRARTGVAVALSIWWKKLGRDGKNVNELTSQVLTDLGRAPTFFDCRVEIERAS